MNLHLITNIFAIPKTMWSNKENGEKKGKRKMIILNYKEKVEIDGEMSSKNSTLKPTNTSSLIS